MVFDHTKVCPSVYTGEGNSVGAADNEGFGKASFTNANKDSTASRSKNAWKGTVRTARPMPLSPTQPASDIIGVRICFD